jgi:hypothetical protein
MQVVPENYFLFFTVDPGSKQPGFFFEGLGVL